MDKNFPEFDLKRLMSTVFGAAGEQKVCILIDLNDPRDVKDFAFLDNEEYSIQKHGYEHFYQAFQNGVMAELGWTGGEMFAYEVTGGSNLDMEDEAFDTNGAQVSLEEDIYKKYDIILCISTYSATAPLTAWAKKIGFRGATLHGLNEIILSSGLAVDYNEISVEAEKLRAGADQGRRIRDRLRGQGPGAHAQTDLRTTGGPKESRSLSTGQTRCRQSPRRRSLLRSHRS